MLKNRKGVARIRGAYLPGILWLTFFCLNGFAQLSDPRATDQKFTAAMMAIRYGYVDTVNEPKLVEDAIIAKLKDLDPHSVYISKKDVEKANEPLQGNFEGIGISFQIMNDTIFVISPTPGGPAEKAGLLAGDKIVKIEGEETTGKKVDNDFVFARLRGKKGTPVTVTVYRKGRKDLAEYTILRDKIPINSLDAAYIVRPGIGYIKLNRFSQTTLDEFGEAMKKLQAQGIKSLILDLRGNSGGYMNPAIDLADEFLGENKLVVYTEGLRSPTQKFSATSNGGFEKGKLIVMIDEGSASSSEIVAGAIQDWDRGLIVGRRSFGKGLVQKPFNLPDGSMIRLTTARYHTPTGRCIQKPYSEGVDEYYKDFSERVKHGELVNPDSIHFPDSLKYHTPKKRVVYGGGGIMPDIFIPWDSARYSDYYTELVRKGVFSKFPLGYVDEHRQEMASQFPDFKSFDEGFQAGPEVMEAFFTAAAKEGVVKSIEGYQVSETLIKNLLKAVLARDLFGQEAYFKVTNEIDDAFLKCLEILKDNSLFSRLKVQY